MKILKKKVIFLTLLKSSLIKSEIRIKNGKTNVQERVECQKITSKFVA